MKRIAVDFNTLNSAPEDLVKFPQDGIPPVVEGERVILTDGELEVEATVVWYTTPWGAHRLMATPDADTWRDLIPRDVPISSAPLAD
jgi:hypothetical protein